MMMDSLKSLRRSVTEINIHGKGNEKLDIKHTPVVSVQYDVPRTPPCLTPIGKLKPWRPTPLLQTTYTTTGFRNKADGKISPVLKGDNSQIQGLGVGRGFEDLQKMEDACNKLHPEKERELVHISQGHGLDMRSFQKSPYGRMNCHHKVEGIFHPEKSKPHNSNSQMEAARDSLSEQDFSHDMSLALDASVRIRFPSDSQLLSKLYSNHGIRVRMIRRTRPPKIPTVRELINQLAKKHEKLLMKEMNEGSAKSVSTTQAESSSSTPTAPYSTADILYNNEVSHSQQEDLRQSSFTDSEKNQDLVSRQKSKEIDNPNNRRPSSKSGSRKSLSIETGMQLTLEKDVTFDREDSSKSSTLPPPKGANHFRPNGIRNNVLKGEPLFSTRSTVAVSSSGREADDLIAMGTLWSPNQTSASLLSHHQSQSQSTLHPGTQPPHHQRSSYTSTMSAGLVNISNSLSSKSLSLNTTMQPPMSTASTSMTLQRKYVSNGIRPIMVQNNLSGLRSIKEKKEEEAKYSDPLVGATPQFLQRIQELQALEGETIRWERTKKLKKKKQDRDS